MHEFSRDDMPRLGFSSTVEKDEGNDVTDDDESAPPAVSTGASVASTFRLESKECYIWPPSEFVTQ